MSTCGTLRGMSRAMKQGQGVEWGGAGLACVLSELQICVYTIHWSCLKMTMLWPLSRLTAPSPVYGSAVEVSLL